MSRAIIGAVTLRPHDHFADEHLGPEEYLEATPFKRGPVTIVKLDARVEGSRTRRLEPAVNLPSSWSSHSHRA